MKTINLNFPINDLEGKELANAGKIIGGNLVAITEGEALKFYDWAVKLHNGESIKVDNADYKKIYEFVENSKGLPILTKAQVMNYLDSVKEEE